MNHFMFDLEMLGRAPNGHILSIGVVEFDPHQATLGSQFYGALDPRKAQPERPMDPDTVTWWLQQSEEARKAVTEGPFFGDLRQITYALDGWLFGRGVSRDNDVVRCWAKPPSYDIEILRHLFKEHGQTGWPFHWRADRDLRTLLETAKLAGVELPERPENGGQHNALDDARWQAQRVIDIYQAIRKQGCDSRGIEWRAKHGVEGPPPPAMEWTDQ